MRPKYTPILLGIQPVVNQTKYNMAPPTPAMLMECCRTRQGFPTHDISPSCPSRQLCIPSAHAPHRRPRPSVIRLVGRRTATTARNRRRGHDRAGTCDPSASNPSVRRRRRGRSPAAPPPVRAPAAAHDCEEDQAADDGDHWDEDRLVVGDPVADLIAHTSALTVAVSTFPSALA